MKCRQHELAFEDYDSGRLSPAETRRLEEHLAVCPQCRIRLEDWRLAGKALSQARMPKASEAFKARLLKHLEEYPVAPARPWWARLQEALVYPLQMGLPMRALAGALVVVVAILVYQQVTTPVRHYRILGGPPPTREAEHPIEIFVPDRDQALADLVTLAAAHGGQLIRRRPVEAGTEVTLRIDEAASAALLRELPRVGELVVRKEGYRNGAGDVVVVLRGAPRK